MKAFSSPPSLVPLYARAAVTARLHRGDTLPNSGYALSEQTIDPGHLAAYQRVCGFRIADELPPTYLHVLVFPLTVALMLERAFPFPLIGLVHVANSITVARPVRADEAVCFTVRASDLRAHPVGRQVDLVSAASIDGEVVWSGRSTYLRREQPAEPRSEKKPTQPEPAGTVCYLRVPENIGRKYAGVSGDRNPIHLHALTARALGFPQAIAHGMWLKARTLASLEGRLPDAFTVEVAFKTPVLLPSAVGIATARTPDGWTLDVRAGRSGKPHLAGQVRAGTSA